MHLFLISALYGSEWSASRPGRYIPGEETPYYPLDRKLSGLQSQSGRGGETSVTLYDPRRLLSWKA